MRVPPDLETMIEPGVAVDARSRFLGSWSSGFEVTEVVIGPAGAGDYRYRLRRIADGALLPVLFSADEISRPR